MKALRNEGITTVGDLEGYTDEELLHIPNFGKRCLAALKAAVAEVPLGKSIYEKRVEAWHRLSTQETRKAALQAAVTVICRQQYIRPDATTDVLDLARRFDKWLSVGSGPVG